MRILFIHQNFPGQYLHLAPALARQGHEVIGLGDEGNIGTTRKTPGVKRLGYASPRMVKNEQQHKYLVNFEAQVRRGQQVARALLQLEKQGFRPDIIYAHPGWGEALFIKDIFPQVPLLCFFEYYYRGRGQDTDFDPEFPADLNARSRIRTWNANNLLALEAADSGICPTEYQKSVQPRSFHHKIDVIHDGIDTSVARPDPTARLGIQLPDREVMLSREDDVVTFVNRNLEPYRGYHTLCRALPEILARKGTQVVIVGGSRKGYGQAPSQGNWKERFFSEVEADIDASRVHFVQRIPYQKLIRLLQLSKAHVYLTYPFVLSWSLLDAMSCGTPIIGSRTPPVEEVIQHEQNGLLVDFFDSGGLARSVHRLLDDPALGIQLGEQARQTVVDNYTLDRCLPRQIELLERVLEAGAGS